MGKRLWLLVLLMFLLGACQVSEFGTPVVAAIPQPPTMTLALTAGPTATPSIVPPTPTPTVTETPSIVPPTPSPLPPTSTPEPTSEWEILPLELPSGVNNALIYAGKGIFTIALAEDGHPVGPARFWYGGASLFLRGLQLSPDGRYLARHTSNESGDGATYFEILAGAREDETMVYATDFEIWDGYLGGGYGGMYLGWAGDSSGLLFTGFGSLALINPEPCILVENPVDYDSVQGAALSPDGRHLVYSYHDYHGDAPSGTWLLDMETNKRTKILDEAIYKAAWSLDGQWIAFMGTGLMIMHPDGSDLQIVQERPYVNAQVAPVWSPNGDGLAFVAKGTANPPPDLYHIFKENAYVADIDATGASNVRPVVPGSGYGYIDPSWSPDGEFLLVVGREGENSEIWLVSRDGKNIRKLTFDGGAKRYPLWWTRR